MAGNSLGKDEYSLVSSEDRAKAAEAERICDLIL
jgi:hypothetical protein